MRHSIAKEAIKDLLKKNHDHPSAEEIHKRLLKLVPGISLMTVYRNLEKFIKKGKCLSFYADGSMRFCWNTKDHFHFFCVGCNKIKLKHNSNLKNLLFELKSRDFSPLENGVLIKGFCRLCDPKITDLKKHQSSLPPYVGYRYGVVE